MKFNDTIAAISTAFGNAGIAIVRLSGPKSFFILKKIFKPKNERINFESHKLYLGKILDKKGEIIDEVLAVYFKTPRSYTKEDMVEIHCHGGFITSKKILERVLEKGARLAEPGEFTKRAFLSGRIDLTQAEAIADIIYAKTEKAQKIAEEQLQGSLKKEINKALNQIIDIYSHILVNIDFPEEDVPEITYKEIIKKVSKVKKEIEKFLEGASLGTIFKEGLKVAIVGLPNVGKSSLLNALVKDARAIVTEIPGTTRDILEEQIEIKGILIRLFDTAGITKTEDIVEKEGILRSFKAIKDADLLLLVIEKFSDLKKFLELTRREIKKDLEGKKIILIRNKIDLKKSPGKLEIPKNFQIIKIIESSAKTGKGILKIEEAIFKEVQKEGIEESVVLTNLRHKKLLEKCLRDLREVKKLVQENEPEDKILTTLTEAKESLEEIIGKVITEDILDKIFSRFCVGK